jgi:hypothetical protein
MPTQPARPQPAQPKARPQDDTAKKWAIIGGITVVVLVGGFFALKTLMEEDRGGRSLVHEMPVESKPVRKTVVDDTPVALLPRPIRLFEEYIRAVQANDKKLIMRYSEIEESKIDLLLTEERMKILTDSLTAGRERGWKYSEKPEKFDTGTTRISAIYMNSRGFEMMELALSMRQRGGPEDWLVTKIEDRWFASSGKTPESRVVELRSRTRGRSTRYRRLSRSSSTGFPGRPRSRRTRSSGTSGTCSTTNTPPSSRRLRPRSPPSASPRSRPCSTSSSASTSGRRTTSRGATRSTARSPL